MEAQGAVIAITPAAMKALDAIRPAGAGGDEKVFGLSESQIARRVKVIAKAAGLADWELFSGHSLRVGMARRGLTPPQWSVLPTPLTGGGRYRIQPPFVSNLPPTRSTLSPPITPAPIPSVDSGLS